MKNFIVAPTRQIGEAAAREMNFSLNPDITRIITPSGSNPENELRGLQDVVISIVRSTRPFHDLENGPFRNDDWRRMLSFLRALEMHKRLRTVYIELS